MDTVEEIDKVKTGKGQPTQLPDPELYIIVNTRLRARKPDELKHKRGEPDNNFSAHGPEMTKHDSFSL